jgi:hypothetical protein
LDVSIGQLEYNLIGIISNGICDGQRFDGGDRVKTRKRIR